MSRIRSVHPGLWTDERFVSVSAVARLLFIGIWNECDDQGSFEWSPLKLKMRLLPADNVDASALLAELESAGCIIRYETDGRQLGAVRNFAIYQRPKKPNCIYPQTPEVRNYCGHKGDEVPNQFPTSGEKAPQMEDGGGRSSPEPNGSGDETPPVDPEKKFWSDAKAALKPHVRGDPGALVNKWLRERGKPLTVAALNAAQLERAVDPVAYCEGYFRRHSANGQPQPVVPL